MTVLKLGSLFDGIGVFPLAAVHCGIEPVWASEIEARPISITKRHFPDVLHLDDITKINGAEIPPVDVITFGSPCQDLSQIGTRNGFAGKKSQRHQNTKFPQSAAALIMRCCLKSGLCSRFLRLAVRAGCPPPKEVEYLLLKQGGRYPSSDRFPSGVCEPWHRLEIRKGSAPASDEEESHSQLCLPV